MKISRRPQISVIIPVHNRHELFKRCFSSVINQNLSKIDSVEIVVVDEASVPNIEGVIRKIKIDKHKFKVRVIRNSRPLGAAGARNQGIKTAKGRAVVFLDSDDIWDRRFLFRSLKNINVEKPEMFSTAWRSIFIGKIGLYNKIFYLALAYFRNASMRLLSALYADIPNQYFYLPRLSTSVFTAPAIRKIHFDMKYLQGEDWKFVWDSIKTNKTKIKFVNEKLADISFHGDSLSSRKRHYIKYYHRLINELPVNVKRTLGIKIFELYTSLLELQI